MTLQPPLLSCCQPSASCIRVRAEGISADENDAGGTCQGVDEVCHGVDAGSLRSATHSPKPSWLSRQDSPLQQQQADRGVQRGILPPAGGSHARRRLKREMPRIPTPLKTWLPSRAWQRQQQVVAGGAMDALNDPLPLSLLPLSPPPLIWSVRRGRRCWCVIYPRRSRH
jgi:hypothetical protein